MSKRSNVASTTPSAAHRPRTLRRARKRPLRLAVDLTIIAYYGKHDRDDPQIYRGKAQRGTNSFFAYATAYLVLHGQRSLAVAPVTRAESLKQVLQELLAVVRKMGLKIGLVLLDRGFYCVAVIRYLCNRRGSRFCCRWLVTVARPIIPTARAVRTASRR